MEAIIRLSEAIAKMSLSPQVTVEHVKEAHRLFQVSTLNAISCGSYASMEVHPDMARYVGQIEETIKKRVAINSRIGYGKLIDELKDRFNNVKAVQMAIENLTNEKVFSQVQQGKALLRLK